jgi:hypothetical protein
MRHISGTARDDAGRCAKRNPAAVHVHHGRRIFQVHLASGLCLRLTGVARSIPEHSYIFCDKDKATKYETRKDIGLRVTGPLGGKNYHFLNVLKRLKPMAGGKAVNLYLSSLSHIFGGLS